MPNKIIKDLKMISSGSMTAKKAKRFGINILELINKGLIKRDIKETKKYLVPENAPRWATKFKFSRKKHGIEEHIIKETYLVLTNKGSKLLKQKAKTKDDPIKEQENKTQTESKNQTEPEESSLE